MGFVPTRHNLIIYASICVLGTLSALLHSDGGLIFKGALAGYAMVLVIDFSISKPLLKTVEIRVPKIIRLSKNRETAFSLTVFRNRASVSKAAIGFALPKLQFDAPDIRHIELAGEKSIISWPITGLKQGQHILETCYMEIPSRFRLWALRKKTAVHCELRVYPDIFSQEKILASRFLESTPGAHAQKKMGKGREFERLREYLPGDLYEDIHWKATARRGTPVTKIYQIERTQDVYVVIDSSRMSARSANGGILENTSDRIQDESILEKYILTALSIGKAAEKQGDKLGLIVFNDHVEQFLPAGGRKSHYTACTDILYKTVTRPVTPDFTELITFIGNRVRKRALLIILTSLDDRAVAESLMDHVHILSRRHLLMINMLKPVNAGPLFSNAGLTSVNEIYEALGGHMAWQYLREAEQNLHRLGIGFFVHPYRELAYQIISEYLKIKQRQVL